MYDVKEFKIAAGSTVSYPVTNKAYMRCFSNTGAAGSLAVVIQDGTGGLFEPSMGIGITGANLIRFQNKSSSLITIKIGFSKWPVDDDRVNIGGALSVQNVSGGVLNTNVSNSILRVANPSGQKILVHDSAIEQEMYNSRILLTSINGYYTGKYNAGVTKIGANVSTVWATTNNTNINSGSGGVIIRTLTLHSQSGAGHGSLYINNVSVIYSGNHNISFTNIYIPPNTNFRINYWGSMTYDFY